MKEILILLCKLTGRKFAEFKDGRLTDLSTGMIINVGLYNKRNL